MEYVEGRKKEKREELKRNIKSIASKYHEVTSHIHLPSFLSSDKKNKISYLSSNKKNKISYKSGNPLKKILSTNKTIIKVG